MFLSVCWKSPAFLYTLLVWLAFTSLFTSWLLSAVVYVFICLLVEFISLCIAGMWLEVTSLFTSWLLSAVVYVFICLLEESSISLCIAGVTCIYITFLLAVINCCLCFYLLFGRVSSFLCALLVWLEVTSLFTLHLHQVSSGLDSLLFNLLVLGVLSDSRGRVWRRRPCDLYIVEVTTGGTECKTQSQAAQAGVSANVWSLFVCARGVMNLNRK